MEGYAARHRVPPGLAGWARISGRRGGIDRPKKLEACVERDIFYVENWSIWIDLRIPLLVPVRLLDTRGAY